GATVALFLAVQLGALALIEPFHDADRQAVEDPENPTNSLVYFAVILVATGFMLATFRYNLEWVIRALVIGVSVFLAWFVLTELVPPVVTAGSINVVAVGAALGVGVALLLYPEWYVIDLTGVLMGAGAAALFGISFGLLPAILLLSALAIYDAISVYRTEHMLDLAEGVMDLKIPVVLVVPTTLSYSYLADGPEATLEEDRNDGVPTPEGSDSSRAEEGSVDAGRDALFIGLGDAIIPTILVASAAYFLEAGALDVPGIALNVPALGAILGTLAGLLVLLGMVLKGRPHAGLPLLNGGAIGGYLLGALASGVSIATALGL
ncbi:presenilin family intramembrane aspartyl protease PSH, partial [Natronococcus sp.]|uniref:presenilin family intramembrane aspartyl protease PSH n=1 Tax=Natronococcus sp. TaxID=35747 RepID=UPI003A4E3190